MGLIGLSRGKDTLKSAEAVVAGATSGATGSFLVDQVAESAIRSVVKVAMVSGATSEVFVENKDFTASGRNLDWSGAGSLPPPELETPTHATGSSGAWWGTGSVTFSITAKDLAGTGETAVYAAQSYTITGVTEHISLQWSKVPLSGGYKVYLTSGGSSYNVATIVGSSSTTYTATGATTGATTIPTSNTTTRRPGTGQTYYVSYYYPVYSYAAKEYTNYSDVLADHGVGSDLANAAKLAFNDNGASHIWVVAASGDTVAEFEAAIDKLTVADVQYLVALKKSDAVLQYLKAHCDAQSEDDVGKFRTAVGAVPSGSTLGSSSESGTILYWLNSLGGDKRVIGVVPNKAMYSVNSWQLTTGFLVDGPYTVGAHFYAAAVAGRLCSLADSATPLTNSQIYGFTWPTGTTLWDDTAYKDTIEAAGGTYVMEESGQHVVYHGITNDATSVENQEISVVAAEDEMRTRVTEVLSGYRGKDRKITENRLTAIGIRVSQVLGYLVKANIIQDFSTVTVTQDADLPTKIWIRFSYTPVYPMNEILFEYGFSTAPLSAAT